MVAGNGTESLKTQITIFSCSMAKLLRRRLRKEWVTGFPCFTPSPSHHSLLLLIPDLSRVVGSTLSNFLLRYGIIGWTTYMGTDQSPSWKLCYCADRGTFGGIESRMGIRMIRTYIVAIRRNVITSLMPIKNKIKISSPKTDLKNRKETNRVITSDLVLNSCP